MLNYQRVAIPGFHGTIPIFSQRFRPSFASARDFAPRKTSTGWCHGPTLKRRPAPVSGWALWENDQPEIWRIPGKFCREILRFHADTDDLRDFSPGRVRLQLNLVCLNSIGFMGMFMVDITWYNYSFHGAIMVYKSTYYWGSPSCRDFMGFHSPNGWNKASHLEM